jgi:hypothetical protein
MANRRADNQGISTGNRTAVAVAKGARMGLTDDHYIADFYRTGLFST